VPVRACSCLFVPVRACSCLFVPVRACSCLLCLFVLARTCAHVWVCVRAIVCARFLHHCSIPPLDSLDDPPACCPNAALDPTDMARSGGVEEVVGGIVSVFSRHPMVEALIEAAAGAVKSLSSDRTCPAEGYTPCHPMPAPLR
jgi:hypothetical protein